VDVGGVHLASEEQFARLYARLISVAVRRQTVHYSEVESTVGLDMQNPPDRDYLGQLLGYISRAEVNELRPMLSSVVWHKGDNTIGQGFQKLGRELNHRKPSDDDDSFLVRELRETWDFWDRLARRTVSSV
jgi:hypothetical protein